MTTVTAYQISRVVNDLLVERGLPEVSSQQIYNATSTLRQQVGNAIPREDAVAFIERYVERRAAGKAVRQSTNELRDELGL